MCRERERERPIPMWSSTTCVWVSLSECVLIMLHHFLFPLGINGSQVNGLSEQDFCTRCTTLCCINCTNSGSNRVHSNLYSLFKWDSINWRNNHWQPQIHTFGSIHRSTQTERVRVVIRATGNWDFFLNETHHTNTSKKHQRTSLANTHWQIYIYIIFFTFRYAMRLMVSYAVLFWRSPLVAGQRCQFMRLECDLTKIALREYDFCMTLMMIVELSVYRSCIYCMVIRWAFVITNLMRIATKKKTLLSLVSHV